MSIMSSTPPTQLSQVTVQPDVLSVINDVEQGVIEQEDVWVSCYESDRPSVHGKVQVTILDEARDQCAFKGRDGVACQKIEEVSTSACHQSGCSIYHLTSFAGCVPYKLPRTEYPQSRRPLSEPHDQTSPTSRNQNLLEARLRSQ